MFLKISQYSQENTFKPVTLLIKRDSNVGVSCEYCKIFKKTYFEKHLWTAASVYIVNLPLIFSVLTAAKMLSFPIFFSNSYHKKLKYYITNIIFYIHGFYESL